MSDKATVETPCLEYEINLTKWTRVTDVIEGSDAVKAKGTTYLPNPDPSDVSEAGIQRYAAYKQKAVWYGATAQTAEGSVGLVFSKPTNKAIPTLLEPLSKNCDGKGNDLDQFSKKMLFEVMSCGRAGILVDFPKRGDEVTTRKDVSDGSVRPKMVFYNKFDIINWRVQENGSDLELSMVVLRENHVTYDEGGFGSSSEYQYRVLLLRDGVFVMEVHRKESGGGFTVAEQVIPTNSKGEAFKYIPFIFIGAKTNDPTVDKPPLLDIADLNIGHYQNSADYEEAVHIMGQPQLTLSGITKDWITDVWKSKGIRFGSRTAIALPKDASCELHQVQPNILAKEAMDRKEKQMAALGATLVEQRDTQQTATEAGFNESAKTSVLSAAADNVSLGITKALEIAGDFVGEEQGVVAQQDGSKQDRILFELSNDFDNAVMTSQDRAQLLKEYSSKVISFTELRTGLKTAGVAFQDDEMAKDEIDSDPNNIVPDTVPPQPRSSDPAAQQ
jgi:hypothetical protein